MGRSKVVFDTNVIRDVAEGQPPGARWRELEGLSNNFHFGVYGPCLLELARQVRDEELAWADWAERRSLVAGVIDCECPVLMPQDEPRCAAKLRSAERFAQRQEYAQLYRILMGKQAQKSYVKACRAAKLDRPSGSPMPNT